MSYPDCRCWRWNVYVVLVLHRVIVFSRILKIASVSGNTVSFYTKCSGKHCSCRLLSPTPQTHPTLVLTNDILSRSGTDRWCPSLCISCYCPWLYFIVVVVVVLGNPSAEIAIVATGIYLRLLICSMWDFYFVIVF